MFVNKKRYKYKEKCSRTKFVKSRTKNFIKGAKMFANENRVRSDNIIAYYVSCRISCPILALVFYGKILI